MEVSETVRRQGAALFAVDGDSFKSLNGNDGAVYLCRRGARAHVIKFIPMPEDRIARWHERLAFISYLAGKGVNIAMPIPSVNGELYERLVADGMQYVVVLTTQASGRSIEGRYPEWNPVLFEAWGRTIGQMHALAKQYPLWRREEPDEVVSAIDNDSPDEHLYDWRMEHQFFARWSSSEPEIVKHWMKLRERLVQLPITREDYGLIHNDLHQHNFLYQEKLDGKGVLTIIDFDVCSYHWFMTDIGIAVFHALLATGGETNESRLAFTRSFLAPFRRGYEQNNILDNFWWQELGTFLKYRQILIYVALSGSWPEQSRNRWQVDFLGKIRRGITSGKPVVVGI